MQHCRRTVGAKEYDNFMKSTIEQTKPFVEQVDQWVFAKLETGARNFASLLQELPGIYPVEVADALRRLMEIPTVSRTARSLLAESESVEFHFRGSQTTSGLPIPHPLDYDWRFTTEAVEELLRASDGGWRNLICLGTPTVFVSAIKRFGCERVVLLDRNTSMIKCAARMSNRSRAIQFDVFTNSLPAIRTDLVVTDPPWYLEHMKAFLWVSSKICSRGGRILMSMPPHGTRPTIAAELDQVFEYARQLGLAVKQIKDDCLTYETPPFETNALRAAGCTVFDTIWRRGSLCVFQRLTDAEVERPLYCCPTSDWLEADLYGSRFRFRRQNQDRIGFDDPTLIPLVAGNILPSVSRRHSLRKHPDVWSSGNRVFRCRGSHVLHEIVRLLASKTSPDVIPHSLKMPLTAREARQVQRAAVLIEEVAAIERFERRFIGRG